MESIRNFFDGMENKRLVAVAAHPDDETAVWPGILFLARTWGWHTTLLVLTEGEAGTNFDLELEPHYPKIRIREMQKAADILRVSELRQANFGDGQLSATRSLWYPWMAQTISQIHPSVIVGFDSVFGITGHSDHVVTGEALIRYSQDRPIHLLQATYIQEQYKPAVPRYLYDYVPSPSHVLSLDNRAIDAQLGAINAHRSQRLDLQWGKLTLHGNLDWAERLEAMPYEHYRLFRRVE